MPPFIKTQKGRHDGYHTHWHRWDVRLCASMSLFQFASGLKGQTHLTETMWMW